MNAPSRTWIEPVLRHRWWVLGLGVVVALATVAASLSLARFDPYGPSTRYDGSQDVRVYGGTWRLQRLYTVPEVSQYGRSQSPVDGAQFVVAEVMVDLTSMTLDEHCLPMLSAGEYRFSSGGSYDPSDTGMAALSCQVGTNGITSIWFEVPTRIVSQVDGLVLRFPTADDLILSGRVN